MNDEEKPVILSLPDLLLICAHELNQCGLCANEASDRDEWKKAKALFRLSELCEEYAKKCGA